MNESVQKSMYSTLGLISIAVLLLAVIALSNTMLRGLRLDLTENQLYTLSDGTRSILQKIDEPINLYMFFSKAAAQDFTSVGIYAKHVRETLEEMTELAEGKLKLTIIDPEPFSDEEDRAVQLGVQAIPLNDGTNTLYFGLAATNALGETAVIPFFSTDRQALLEYDLTKLIYQLSQAEKPVVGLLSTLDMDGGFDARRMQAKQPWIVLEQLRQFFEVRSLEVEIETVPEDIDLLVVAHPADLNPATLYAIDQFVLRGGNLLVFVDPYAESVTALRAGGEQGVAQQSDLSPLLSTWGVRLRPDEVIGDARYALRVTTDPAQPPARHYAMLGVRGSTLNQDDVITRGLESINLAFAGILEPLDDAKMDFTPLITTSDKAMPLPSFRVQPGLDPAELQRGFKPSGNTYVLAARISGSANSAYPDGPPAAQDTAAEDLQDPSSAGDEPDQAVKQEDPAQAGPNTDTHKRTSTNPINVVVVADTDVLTDRLWVRLDNFFGRQIATPFADNADLMINAVDNLLGSSDLISIRSRAGYSRPFDRVNALRLEAEGRFRAKEQELQARLQETERKINELQRQKGEGGSAIVLDAEQQATIKGFQRDLIQTRKELRTVRHELNKNIENLGTALKFINIVLVPLLLSIAVIVFILVRRRKHTTELMGKHA